MGNTIKLYTTMLATVFVLSLFSCACVTTRSVPNERFGGANYWMMLDGKGVRISEEAIMEEGSQ